MNGTFVPNEFKRWINALIGAAGTSAAWGSITGTLTNQSDLVAYISSLVAGVAKLQGNLDCSANPNYPAGTKGDLYYVTVAGKIGGASGTSVDIGDAIVCKATNGGGTQASVGASWFILEHNLVGALLTNNNLSDLANATTARSNLGLGNVDNTADAVKSVASAAVLTTPRNIDGQAFDGSSNISVIAPGTHAATSKTTPVDADELPLVDSAASNVLKKLTFLNLKAGLKTYFDTAYGTGTVTSVTSANNAHATVANTTTTPVITIVSAPKLTTARNIDGQGFDGSADVTVVAPATHAATTKTTPVDADEIPIADSAATFGLKKLSWANLKATIKAYTDTLYPSGSGSSTGINTGDQTNVTGNAGTATALQTARNIDGQSFDGTANITVIAPGTHAAISKSTPVDADELSLVDSAASNVLKKLTWANAKVTLKAYFDPIYQAVGSYAVTTNNLSDLSSLKTAFDNLTIHGADIASASTVNLDTATGDLVDVTGTTTITAITLSNGRSRTVRFTGSLTLTNGASLVLPSGANITTAAGDFAIFRGYSAGVVRCVLYSRADGTAVAGSGGSSGALLAANNLSDLASATTAVGNLGLGNVDNTHDSAKNVASAAILTTARNIDGISFNGSANITVVAPATHAATSKTTPVDADEIPLADSAASFVLKKLSWANLKATIITALTQTVTSNSSATYTESVTSGSKTVLHDATSANITHNLPTAAGNTATLTIKKIDSSAHTITVDANSTETIDGGLTAVIQAQYAAITIVSDGSNWVVI